MNPDFVTIRSLVVLLFLMGLPIVAIMPNGVQGALRGFWPEAAESSNPTAVHLSGSSEPLLAAPAQYSAASIPPAELPPVTRLADLRSASQEGSPPVRPTTYELPSSSSLPARSSLAHNNPHDNPAGPPSTDPIDQLPLPSDRLTAPTASPTTGSAALVTHETEQLQEELDRLGATYYRLESWGDAPRVYRFHCTVTITIGLAEYSRRFEATAQHPQQAMQQVLGEVQDWHDRFPSATSSERPDGE